MGKFGVSDDKELALLERMARLGIREGDLDENFIRGSGSGGQKINKTSSCVQLIHRPSGIEIRCQADRSQALNRFLARRELCERIETQRLGIQTERAKEAHKLKKQKHRRSRRAKARMVEAKRSRGEVKRGRQVRDHD